MAKLALSFIFVGLVVVSMKGLVAVPSVGVEGVAKEDPLVGKPENVPEDKNGTINAVMGDPQAACMICGGYSYTGCSNYCYWSGYPCYSCSANPCYCTCNFRCYYR